MKQKIVMTALLLAGMAIGAVLAGPALRTANAMRIDGLYYWESGPGVLALKLRQASASIFGCRVVKVGIGDGGQGATVLVSSE